MSKQFQQSVKENPQIDKVWVSEKMEFYTFEMPNCKEVSREELLAADFKDDAEVVTAAVKDDSIELAGKIIELQDKLDEAVIEANAKGVEFNNLLAEKAELEKANEDFARVNTELQNLLVEKDAEIEELKKKAKK